MFMFADAFCVLLSKLEKLLKFMLLQHCWFRIFGIKRKYVDHSCSTVKRIITITNERALSNMSQRVMFQMFGTQKRLIAIPDGAVELSLIGVRDLVPSELAGGGKRPFAISIWATVRPLARVQPHVLLQTVRLFERLPTARPLANKIGRVMWVKLPMGKKSCFSEESSGTVWLRAAVSTLGTTMRLHVKLACLCRLEHLGAVFDEAGEVSRPDVRPLMTVQVVDCGEATAATFRQIKRWKISNRSKNSIHISVKNLQLKQVSILPVKEHIIFEKKNVL